jgi:hypothetical protein
MNGSGNSENKAAYEAELPRLREQYPIGYFAVFAGAAFLGAFPHYGDALRQGYERAGRDDFFVKQITSAEEIQRVATPLAVA